MTTLDNAVPPDVSMDLQIYVNSIIMGSFLSQLVIVIQFLSDMHLMTNVMKGLGGLSLILGTLTALVSFLGNNQVCEPLQSLGCFIFLFSKLASWVTFALRIWALSGKDVYIGTLVAVLVALAFAGNAGSCGISTYVRALPRLCAPKLNPQLQWFNVVYSASVPIMCFVFIGLHIYYLRRHYANSKMLSGNQQANKVTATLKLFGNSIGVLLVDGVTHAFRDSFSKQGPVYFFALVFGGQILKDFIYCGYMKQFGNELRKLRNPDATTIPSGANGSGIELSKRKPEGTGSTTLPGMARIRVYKEKNSNIDIQSGFGEPVSPERSYQN